MITVQGAKTFSQILPTIRNNQDNAYFRFDWAPGQISLQTTVARPRWTALDSSSAPLAISSARPDSHQATIAKPNSPSWIDVADGQDLTRIWFVSATIEVRNHGFITPDNPYWPRIRLFLQERVLAPGHSFNQLGLTHFHTEIGRRYGGMVEIVGRVTPSEIHQTEMFFYIARRLTRGTVTAWDAHRRPLPQERDPRASVRIGDDTSLFVQKILTPAGELFDYDVPGSVMGARNLINDQHIWDLSFEQCVVIGSTDLGTDPWPRISRDGLAVSPIITSRFNYTATVRRPISGTQDIDLVLTGSISA